MRIFNEEKTKELFDPDLKKGYLRQEKLLKKHHDAIPEKIIKTVEQVKNELISQGKEVNLRTFENEDGKIESNYYFVTKIYYKNGNRIGNDEEQVKEIKEEGKEAWDEYEDVEVYVPYSEEENAKISIAKLKKNLFETDYKAIKYAEGYLTEEEYAPIKLQRQAWRDEINALEEKLI